MRGQGRGAGATVREWVAWQRPRVVLPGGRPQASSAAEGASWQLGVGNIIPVRKNLPPRRSPHASASSPFAALCGSSSHLPDSRPFPPSLPPSPFLPPLLPSSPQDNNLVGAGQYNGQLAYFDVRKGNGPVEATPIDISHRDPIYDFAWLQSKTGTECMTVSTDGNVLWWDLRKMNECVENMPLKEKNSETTVGGVCLEYDTNAGPTNFMVGTEQGQIFSCNRKAKNPVDRVKYVLSGHHGPIYGLRRNPFNSKYFLSIGDWTARVWVEDTAVKTPILTTKYHPTYLTGGTWSPSRPGVFFTIKMDGAMDVWDLYYKHNEPTLTVQVSDLALTAFAVQESGGTVAVGTSDGCTSVLQLSTGLSEASPAEKANINAMFERETTREKNLEKAIKEAKVKARKEQARRDEVKDNVTEEQLKALEDEFFKTTDPAVGGGYGAGEGAAAE